MGFSDEPPSPTKVFDHCVEISHINLANCEWISHTNSCHQTNTSSSVASPFTATRHKVCWREKQSGTFTLQSSPHHLYGCTNEEQPQQQKLWNKQQQEEVRKNKQETASPKTKTSSKVQSYRSMVRNIKSHVFKNTQNHTGHAHQQLPESLNSSIPPLASTKFGPCLEGDRHASPQLNQNSVACVLTVTAEGFGRSSWNTVFECGLEKHRPTIVEHGHDDITDIGILKLKEMCDRSTAAHDLFLLQNCTYRIFGTSHHSLWQPLIICRDPMTSLRQAIITFAETHPREEFILEINWEYARDLCSLTGQDLKQALIKAIDKKRKINFQNKDYIPYTDLKALFTEKLIRHLIVLNFETQESPYSSQEIERLVSYIAQSAVRLQAACAYSGVGQSALLHLIHNGLNDGHGVDMQCTCGDDVCAQGMHSLRCALPLFFTWACDFGPLEVSRTDTTIPICFDRLTDRIGSGGYGVVYKVKIDLNHNKLKKKQNCSCFPDTSFALKIFKQSIDTRSAFTLERSALEKLVDLQHEGIVHHLASWTQLGNSYIAFPLADQDLHQFLQRESIHDYGVKWMVEQAHSLASALSKIHNFNVGYKVSSTTGSFPQDGTRQKQQAFTACYHGDLKPENILVFKESGLRGAKWKIADFGTSNLCYTGQKSYQSAMQQHRGTVKYEAPEIVAKKSIDHRSDIWSFGCVLLLVALWATGDQGSKLNPHVTFWSHDNGIAVVNEQILDDIRHLESGKAQLWNQLAAVIRGCLMVDPNERLTAPAITVKLGACLEDVAADTGTMDSDDLWRDRIIDKITTSHIYQANTCTPVRLAKKPLGTCSSAPAKLQDIQKEFILSLNSARSFPNTTTSLSRQYPRTAQGHHFNIPTTKHFKNSQNQNSSQSNFNASPSPPVDLGKLEDKDGCYSHANTAYTDTASSDRSTTSGWTSENYGISVTAATDCSDIAEQALPVVDQLNTLISDPRVKAHLHDPAAHLRRLQQLEISVYRRFCSVGAYKRPKQPSQYGDPDEVSALLSLTLHELQQLRGSISQYAVTLEAIESSIILIKDMDDPEAGFGIIVDTPESTVCRVEYVTLLTVRLLLQVVLTLEDYLTAGQTVEEMDWTSIEELLANLATMCQTFLSHLGKPSQKHSNSMSWVGRLMLTSSVLQLLVVGLTSYVSSHTGSVSPTVAKFLQNQSMVIGFTDCGLIQYERRRLACLSQLLGDDVWVFSFHGHKNVSDNPIAISLYVADFDDLWGPIEMVCGSDQNNLIALRTFGGNVVPNRPQFINSFKPTSDEVLCHYYPSRDEEESTIEFDLTKRLLIGAPSSIFHINESCTTRPDCVRSFIAKDVFAENPGYETTGRSMGMTVGLPRGPVSISAVRHQRKLHAMNARTVLLEHFKQRCKSRRKYTPPPEVLQLIDRCIVLEISRCTRNGRFITLFAWLCSPEIEAWKNERDHDLIQQEKSDWNTWPSFMEMWRSVQPQSQARAYILDVIGDALRIMEHTGGCKNGLIKIWDAAAANLRLISSGLVRLLFIDRVSAVFACWSNHCFECLHGRRCLSEHPDAKDEPRHLLIPLLVKRTVLQESSSASKMKDKTLTPVPSPQWLDNNDGNLPQASTRQLSISQDMQPDTEFQINSALTQQPKDSSALVRKVTKARLDGAMQLDYSLMEILALSKTQPLPMRRRTNRLSLPREIEPIDDLLDQNDDFIAKLPEKVPYVEYHLNNGQGRLCFDKEQDHHDIRVFDSYEDVPLLMHSKPSRAAAISDNPMVNWMAEKVDKGDAWIGNQISKILPTEKDELVRFEFVRAEEIRREKLDPDSWVMWALVRDQIKEC